MHLALAASANSVCFSARIIDIRSLDKHVYRAQHRSKPTSVPINTLSRGSFSLNYLYTFHFERPWL